MSVLADMRRGLAVLLLVASCAASCTGGGRATEVRPTYSPPADTCEQEAKTAHLDTYVVDLRTGAQVSKAPGSLRVPMKGGLFYHDQPLPRITVPHVAAHPGDPRTASTFRPPGRPAWVLPGGRPLTEVNGVVVVQDSLPRGLYAVDALDGHLKWIQGSLLDYGITVFGTSGNDLLVMTRRSYRDAPALLKVDAKTFVTRWRLPIPRADFAAVSGDYVIVITSAESYAGQGEVQVIDQRTGTQLWRKRFPLPRISNARIDGVHLVVDDQTRSDGGGCE